MCLASQDTSVLGGVSCRARSLQTVPSDKIPELCHVSPSSGLDSTILYERNLDSAQPKQSPKLLNQRHMSVHSFQALLPYCFNRPQASYLELIIISTGMWTNIRAITPQALIRNQRASMVSLPIKLTFE